jgi:hypothetical protein
MPSRRPFLLLPHATATAYFIGFLMRRPPEVGAPARRINSTLRQLRRKKTAGFSSQLAVMGCSLKQAAAIEGYRSVAPDGADQQGAMAPSKTQPFGILYTAKTPLEVLGSGSRL